MTKDVERLINRGSISITPVKVGQKNIGVISSHTFNNSPSISDEVFSELSFLFDHLNMYLSAVSTKR